MANQEHLQKIKQGVSIWNNWRNENPDLRPNLEGADLRGLNLRGAQLSFVYLVRSNLIGVSLNGADLKWAYLIGSNLNKADLGWADLTGADLRGATLREANLVATNLNKAKLDQVDFGNAGIGWTSFGDVDLSTAKGLDTVGYSAASTIGVDTVYRSRGQIPEFFLRGCGVPESFIEYVSSFVRSHAEFYSCFISYSVRDKAFVQRLSNDLRKSGIRCWFFSEDIKAGEELWNQIGEAIRINDKLLVVLSENSIESPWVAREVESALQQEIQQSITKIFPIRIDNVVVQSKQSWITNVLQTRILADFRDWKNPDIYQRALSRLVRDLNTTVAAESSRRERRP